MDRHTAVSDALRRPRRAALAPSLTPLAVYLAVYLVSSAMAQMPEPLELSMYGRIRDEGNAHSRIMDYAAELVDGIGPRLTGSRNLSKANEWARDRLAAMGCGNARLESWGEFGMGWRERNTWIRMTAPDIAVLIARAAPWSCSHQR